MSDEKTYTLITVTYGGEVRHSRGFETLGVCEQAKSIALTGMTIEANAAAETARRQWEEEVEREWREAHPPRVPTPAECEQWKGMLGSSGPFCTIGADGLLYEHPGGNRRGDMSPGYNPNNGEAVVYEHGQWVKKYAADTKFAECVIEPCRRDPG